MTATKYNSTKNLELVLNFMLETLKKGPTIFEKSDNQEKNKSWHHLASFDGRNHIGSFRKYSKLKMPGFNHCQRFLDFC